MILKKIKGRLLNSSNKRNALIKKNIVSSFLLKVINLGIDFLLVPLTLSYLTQTNYGVWLLISSIINWFNLFDLGISHGYRNKLAIALSKNNFVLARELTTTAYFIIGIISSLLCVLSLLVIPSLNWNMLLNVDTISNKELIRIIQIVTVSFSLKLLLKSLGSIFQAKQLPALKSLYETLAKALVLVGVLILVKNYDENLSFYVIVSSAIPVILLFILSFYFFWGEYSYLKPSFKYLKKERIKDITGLGIKFFILQLGAAMLFLSDNMIISHLYSPSEVTPYMISKKYFSIGFVVFAIVAAPYWSAFTEAYEKGEFGWIKNSIKILNKFWIFAFASAIVMLFVFYPFLKFWVGDDFEVPILLAFQWAIFVVLQSKNNIYTLFLNGTGKITMQLITVLITIVLNIPLSIYFAKYLSLGTSGVLLATNCSLLLYIVTRKIQYHKIITHQAYGIWNK